MSRNISAHDKRPPHHFLPKIPLSRISLSGIASLGHLSPTVPSFFFLKPWYLKSYTKSTNMTSTTPEDCLKPEKGLTRLLLDGNGFQYHQSSELLQTVPPIPTIQNHYIQTWILTLELPPNTTNTFMWTYLDLLTMKKPSFCAWLTLSPGTPSWSASLAGPWNHSQHHFSALALWNSTPTPPQDRHFPRWGSPGLEFFNSSNIRHREPTSRCCTATQWPTPSWTNHWPPKSMKPSLIGPPTCTHWCSITTPASGSMTWHPTSVHTLETQLQSEAHPIQAKPIYRSTRPLYDNTRTNTAPTRN